MSDSPVLLLFRSLTTLFNQTPAQVPISRQLAASQMQQLEVNWNHHGITESPRRLRRCGFEGRDLHREVFSKVQEASQWVFFFRPRVGEKVHCHCTCGTHSSNKVDRTGHSAPRLRALVNHKLPGGSDCIFSSRLARFPWVPTRCFEPSVFSNGSNFLSQQNAQRHIWWMFFLTSGGLMGIGDEKRCEKHENTLEPAGCF